MGTFRKITGVDDQRRAARAAAAQQAEATDKAQDLTWKMFEENQERLAPWVSAGEKNLNALSAAMAPGGRLYDTEFSASDFETFKDPSYDWRVGQGANALAAQAAATGNYGSGNMATALVDYGQNAASQEYANAYGRYMNSQNTLYDRLYNLSSMGSNAAAGVANLGTNTAGAMGEYGIQGANALAAGGMADANIKANSYQQLLGMGGSALGAMGGIGGVTSALGGVTSALGGGLESLLGLGTLAIL